MEIFKNMYGNGRDVHRVEVGDRIICHGYSYEIAEIISQNDWGEDPDGTFYGIYVEFKDTNGDYHYWKQGIDGGLVVSKKE